MNHLWMMLPSNLYLADLQSSGCSFWLVTAAALDDCCTDWPAIVGNRVSMPMVVRHTTGTAGNVEKPEPFKSHELGLRYSEAPSDLGLFLHAEHVVADHLFPVVPGGADVIALPCIKERNQGIE